MKSDWGPSGRVLANYVSDIRRLFAHYFPDPNKPPSEFLRELRMMGIDLDFSRVADIIAQRMVTSVARGNSRNWRAAAAKASKGRLIHEALKDELTGMVGAAVQLQVFENSRLIRSLPTDLAARVSAYIASRQLEGARSDQISKELKQKIPHVAMSRIKLIARTETAKAETAVTKARAENLGIRLFQWATSEDQRVRRSHRFMDKVVIPWSTPPAPEELIGERSEGHYLPGNIYNCRCVALPLVDIDELEFPVRVYAHNAVVRMNRNQFLKFSRISIAA